eukprot:scaffold187933_cov29-Tisochrysis_lutea.AAC.5
MYIPACYGQRPIKGSCSLCCMQLYSGWNHSQGGVFIPSRGGHKFISVIGDFILPTCDTYHLRVGGGFGPDLSCKQGRDLPILRALSPLLHECENNSLAKKKLTQSLIFLHTHLTLIEAPHLPRVQNTLDATCGVWCGGCAATWLSTWQALSCCSGCSGGPAGWLLRALVGRVVWAQSLRRRHRWSAVGVSPMTLIF